VEVIMAQLVGIRFFHYLEENREKLLINSMELTEMVEKENTLVLI
jgi:hypothetical protein